ncbi:MAG: GNAT family N-acetyltransferase [Pleomorphochaeta sp.]
MNNIKFRLMEIKDAQEILNIYKPYIEDTSITFECTVPTLVNFEKRLINISKKYSYLVCEVDNKIIGYAYGSRLREREAYQWDAELSIYLNQEYVNLGIGKLLYCALIDMLKLQNIHNVYGVITQPNEKSENLHSKLGFSKIGVFHNTGNKFNAWRDVVWYEKNILDFEKNPTPIIPITEVEKKSIYKILSKYNLLLSQKLA